MKEFKAGKLKVKMYASRGEMGQKAAAEAAAKIKEFIAEKGEVNIVFGAAPSQNEFLAALIVDSGIAWGKINAFHMDEYIGLTPDAPQGFGNFLKDRLFEKVVFKSVNYLDGNAADIAIECKRYSNLLEKYPVDIVCMGIGENGHIAFNDPHVANFNDPSRVKKVEMDERCRRQQVNDGCFSSIDKVPTHALTLTVPALMAGRCLFCMVPAKAKADAVFHTVKGEITETCPASILKTHNNAVLYLDKDSGSRLD